MLGLNRSNGKANRQYEFCQGTGMVTTNAWFNLPKQRHYTRNLPNNARVSKQIESILVSKRFRNNIRM